MPLQRGFLGVGDRYFARGSPASEPTYTERLALCSFTPFTLRSFRENTATESLWTLQRSYALTIYDLIPRRWYRFCLLYGVGQAEGDIGGTRTCFLFLQFFK